MDKMTSVSAKSFLLGLVARTVARPASITLFADPIDLHQRRRFTAPDGPGLAPRTPRPSLTPEMLEQDAERWDGMA